MRYKIDEDLTSYLSIRIDVKILLVGIGPKTDIYDCQGRLTEAPSIVEY